MTPSTAVLDRAGIILQRSELFRRSPPHSLSGRVRAHSNFRAKVKVQRSTVASEHVKVILFEALYNSNLHQGTIVMINLKRMALHFIN
ncbi:hypothetical protein J6590_026280 [Homalodisca vitripennis]|nr:hypothetical protein J6590_026280 [Homalodisca vitripennis]